MKEPEMTPQQAEKLVDYVTRHTGMSREQLYKAYQGLTASPQTAGAEALLRDEAKLTALLNSPQAQELLRKILGEP